MIRTLSVFTLVAGCLVPACGGGAPPVATAPAGPAADLTPTPAAQPAAAPDAADSTPAGPSEAASGPSQEDLQKKKSLDVGESPFPKIDEVTQDLGPPAKRGKGKRVSFWYGAKTRFDDKTKKEHSTCLTFDLVRTPSGGVVPDHSINNSPECKKIKATLAQVHEALDELAGEKGERHPAIELRDRVLRGKTYDAVVATFEKKLGKAPEAGEPDYAAWSYVVRQDETTEELGAEQACRMVLVTSHLGSNAGQALWDVPCE